MYFEWRALFQIDFFFARRKSFFSALAYCSLFIYHAQWRLPDYLQVLNVKSSSLSDYVPKKDFHENLGYRNTKFEISELVWLKLSVITTDSLAELQYKTTIKIYSKNLL